MTPATGPRYAIVRRCHGRAHGLRCDNPRCPCEVEQVTTDSATKAAQIAKNWRDYDARVVDRAGSSDRAGVLAAAGASVRAALVKAATEAVGYVTTDFDFADLVKGLGLTGQEARWVLESNAATLVNEIKALRPA